MKLICINRKPIPAATRYYFFVEDASTKSYASTEYEPEDSAVVELDNRRSAFLSYDKMTIPIGGDGRIMVGPGDMLAGVQACWRAGVKMIVDPRSVDVLDALHLARGVAP